MYTLRQRSRQQLPPIKRSMMRSQLDNHKQEKNQKIGSYIQNSLKNIQQGCYKNGRICIDEGYGDYRMSIFRLKDRKKKYYSNPTVFNDSFLQNISQLAPELQQQFKKIASKKYQNENAQTLDPEQVKPNIAPYKGQEQEYLYFQYVPKYQKQKWFKKTIALPELEQQKKEPPTTDNRLNKKKKAKKNDNTHFFRFMENDYRSMLFSNSS